MAVSLSQWMTHYESRLLQAGICSADARIAALVGWEICLTHQACFGVLDAPVNFYTKESEQLVGCEFIAACRSGRFGGFDQYAVYPQGIEHKIEDLWQQFGGLTDRACIRQAVAVHEVRHRVQDREIGTLIPFRRDILCGTWFDEQARIVADNKYEEFAKQEEHMRAHGESEENIAWVLSDVEFDAEVVERLYLHQRSRFVTYKDLAAFVRMNAPVVPL